MNSKLHWLGLWSGVCLLITGIPEAFPGPRFLPASWALIFDWLPVWLDWAWPGLFILAGVAATAGTRSERALILGFSLTALAYFVWGSVSMYGWRTDQGGTIPGSMAYYLIAGYAAGHAWTVYKNRTIEKQVSDLGESITSHRGIDIEVELPGSDS